MIQRGKSYGYGNDNSTLKQQRDIGYKRENTRPAPAACTFAHTLYSASQGHEITKFEVLTTTVEQVVEKLMKALTSELLLIITII